MLTNHNGVRCDAAQVARRRPEGAYGAEAGDDRGATGGQGIALALSGVPMGALASPR